MEGHKDCHAARIRSVKRLIERDTRARGACTHIWTFIQRLSISIKAKLSPGGCLACKAKKQSCSGPPHCGLCLRRGHACVFKACTLKGDLVDLQTPIPKVLRSSKMMDTVHGGTKQKGKPAENMSPTPVETLCPFRC